MSAFRVTMTKAKDSGTAALDSRIEPGSGNVFADLGRPDAEAHLLKAELVSRIDEIIRRRRLTQARAAELLSLSQPDVSRLLRGQVRDYSVERLLRLLTLLGRDVEIVIRKLGEAFPGSALAVWILCGGLIYAAYRIAERGFEKIEVAPKRG